MQTAVHSRLFGRMPPMRAPGQPGHVPKRRVTLHSSSIAVLDYWDLWKDEDQYQTHPGAIRYLFEVPRYIPTDQQHTVLKILACDPGSDSVKWEVEGERENRTVEVNPESDTHLLSVLVDDPSPVEVMVKVTCPFGKLDGTQLALMVPAFIVQGVVETAELRTCDESDFKERVQCEIDMGLHAKPEWEIRVLALAEAAATTPLEVSHMSDLVKQAYQMDERWVSMPIGRVHVPPGTSVAALCRLANASFLPPEEAQAQLVPPQPIRSWLAAQKPKTVRAS